MKRTSCYAQLTVFALIVLALCLTPSLTAQTVNCTGVTAWVPNIQVTAGELVTFNGQEFKTIQSHTTLAGWEPPNVPALFSLVGTCGGTSTPTPTPTKPPATATPTPSSGGAGCAAPWNSTTQYCGGAMVSVGGNNYTAQFCNTNQNPTTPGNSGSGGTGDPWFPPVACMV